MCAQIHTRSTCTPYSLSSPNITKGLLCTGVTVHPKTLPLPHYSKVPTPASFRPLDLSWPGSLGLSPRSPPWTLTLTQLLRLKPALNAPRWGSALALPLSFGQEHPFPTLGLTLSLLSPLKWHFIRAACLGPPQDSTPHPPPPSGTHPALFLTIALVTLRWGCLHNSLSM